jgi:gliding motility-associated lipoprotein GldB
MKKIVVYIVVSLIVFSCENVSKIESEIDNIEIDIKIERFDELFSQSDAESLPKLKAAYPFMFSDRITDEELVERLNDTLQIQLQNEVSRTFKKFPEKDDIVALFKHLKYHYKEFRTPRVITVTSDVDYRNKSIVTDSIVIIALDTYLGEKHEFYSGIQHYLKQNFKREMMISDLASNYAENFIYKSEGRTFLDNMIYFGKILYFKDMIIPFVSDELKIGYTKDQLAWALSNESNIWRNFVENELLFSTDQKLAGRFINPAPYSKFNLQLDQESPGRPGQYIGWQIVRSYMNNNDETFKQMLLKNAEDIFNNSKFKPRK